DEATPLPKLDNALSNLLARKRMTPTQQQHYAALVSGLDSLLGSEIECPGDGNLDQVVDNTDIKNWKRFNTANGGHSSWYDFNHDGLTDAADLAIIQQNLGRDCRPNT